MIDSFVAVAFARNHLVLCSINVKTGDRYSNVMGIHPTTCVFRRCFVVDRTAQILY
jgi:hypothetical protein